MIDPQLLKTNIEAIEENLRKRDLDIDLDKLKLLDESRRALKFESEKLRAEQKKLGKEIASASEKEKVILLEKAEKISDKVKSLSEETQQKDEEFFDAWIKIPNIVNSSSPVGKTDEDNKEIKKVGEPKNIKNPMTHLEIGENLGLIDVERASKISGSRFSYLFGDLVKIQFNLVSYTLNKLSEKGFNPTIPPVLVRENALFGTGFFPDDSDQVYEVQNDDLFLVGTSEVSLAALHTDEIIDMKNLPLRYAGYSTCFRREAGTYGKDTSGIFRVHQFDKVEMFSFCDPEKSYEEHEQILAIEEEILKDLEIPYRVVDVCTGDLGASAAKKYDIEAWIPSQKKYREVTSCSNTTDFQARRLNMRTKNEDGNTILHTLNGTALAVGRILIALLENNQQSDGSVTFSDDLGKILGVNKLS
ncbi:serine--tRNA ligase [Acidimicrobiaceae bacterium]|uniref:Serine--tRNA ligase n=1 Tax=Candidatus Actinomarina minuta TaxID=1389454 RepID=S5DQU9_9ACTN|nr:seryl-tRNA synthetase [Candidatus Actinomarina minuta]MDC3103186.1 serine--tRNA ligase [Acidimicrobiaceae bacterium]